MASNLRSDWQEQLMALRGLTAMTGALHEAQVYNLKQWGALAFAHVGKGRWQIEVDIDGRNITYALSPKRSVRRPAALPKLVAALDRSVHWLLGDEWALHVTEHGKTIYAGERKVAASEKTHGQRNARAGNRASISTSE